MSDVEHDASRPVCRYGPQLSLKRGALELNAAISGQEQRVPVSQDVATAVSTPDASYGTYAVRRNEAYQASMDAARAQVAADAYEKFQLGRAARRDGQPSRAAAAFEAATQEQPDFYLAWYDLGLAYEQLGDKQKAEDAYKKAVQYEDQQPKKDASIFNTYGWLLYREGRMPEAISNFQKALAIDPNHPKAKRNLAAAMGAH